MSPDGKPIIMLSDHVAQQVVTQKLKVIISADYDKIVQLPPRQKLSLK